ncbi:MAG: FAD-dependent oxidoreductase [Chlamydiota bacterium]
MFYCAIITMICSFAICLQASEPQTTSPKEIHLKTPDLSDENFLGARVGIRPYRKSGPRVEEEYYGDKLIVHNYGYSGSGVTLCWGGAQRVIDLLSSAFMRDPSLLHANRIAVLGAGVIGLSTAYELLKLGYDVTIYSKEFSPNLTSDVAIGIWSPPSLNSIQSSEKKQALKYMLEVSRKRYLQLATAEEPEFLGVGFIDDYIFKNADYKQLKYFKPKFKDQEPKIVVQFDNGLRKTGSVKRILSIDGKQFIKDLFTKVKLFNASIVERHIENIEDILDLEEPIVVNCTSFGAEKLFNDQEFLPIRGHILFFKNVHNIDYMTYENVSDETSTWVGIYPRGDELIISGTLEEGVREKSVDPAIVQKMLNNVRSKFSPKAPIGE